MPLVTISDLTIRYRGPALLDDVSCLIEPGDRIGLLGRNGAGKTTLLRMLAGTVKPDHGRITTSNRTKIALLQQDVPQDLTGTVHEIILSGIDANQIDSEEPLEDWQRDLAVEQIATRMQLDLEARFETMSSGMKRRVLLASALADEPDLLLLDEPTNHLDIEAIEWLEEFLARWPKAFMFITHDRQFLRKLAKRILEIDSGKIFDWTCDYDTFLKRKEAAMAAEEKQNALFDKKLAQEEVWIRQGIKARRTRNEGRVRALKELRLIRGERRSKVGTANLKIQEAARSGNLVLHADQLNFAYGDRQILRDFSTTVMRGEKVGIIGRNGAGKTTLLRLLLGTLEPQSGKLRIGTNVQIVYFDQLRAQLNDEKTVQEDVGDGYENVNVNGRSQHIIGYLQDFLFTPERARTQIKMLSGGERNRVLLAKLFTKPANLIVLDEPTNDLDAETLDMLEERLLQYSGTLLIVSHDREFLNNVVTSSIVFEDDGVNEYVGGYDDWVRQSNKPDDDVSDPATSNGSVTKSDAKTSVVEAVKLNFKERQELSSLPKLIESLEAKIAEKHEQMGQPDFYKRPAPAIAQEKSSLEDLQSQLATTYQRWEELEARA